MEIRVEKNEFGSSLPSWRLNAQTLPVLGVQRPNADLLGVQRPVVALFWR